MKVLMATDGSEHSIEAARFLSRLAGKEKFDVTIFSVSFDPRHPHSNSVDPWYPEWVEGEKKRVADYQEAIHTMLASKCDAVAAGQTFGDPVPCILEEAKRIKADLIVVGAKGHTTLHRLVLGSTSDSVATHAKCSVLVVRDKHPTAAGRTDQSGQADKSGQTDQAGQADKSGQLKSSQAETHPKILFAFDGSQGAREAIREQLELNWDPQTEVNVVAVAAQAYAFFDDTYAAMAAAYETEQVERIRCEAERVTGEIAETLPNTNLQVPRANHIGDAIVTAAEENSDDLVVVGDAGHSLIGEIFLGNTSKYVLRHAPCSVWISRHHRQSS